MYFYIYGTLIAISIVNANNCIYNFKPYVMKNLILLISGIVLTTYGVQAKSLENKVQYTTSFSSNNAIIFVENGITFSIYRDGEFDFYMQNRINVANNAAAFNTGYTFNSGYNYNSFVQYDAYGAVIQVENVPIYYDYYGRVNQIGAIPIRYNNGYD